MPKAADKQASSLEDQVVLVTGGSKGLGLLLARDFARLGAAVTICSRSEPDLQAAQAWLADQGLHVDIATCDVSKKDEAEALIHGLEGRAGRIDYLVNNAGVIQVGPLDALEIRDFEDAMNTMLWGMVVSSLAVLPGMKARRHGRIVNITSLGAKISVPHLLPYSTAKYAALGFSKGLRSELAGSGVRVVTVAPGLMRTGSFANALFKGDTRREFTWFSTLSSLPLLSIDAERAAARIVKAATRGEPELILSLPANLGARIEGVFPGTFSYLLSLTARLLPSAGPVKSTVRRPGHELDDASPTSIEGRLKTLGTRAKKRFQPPFSRP